MLTSLRLASLLGVLIAMGCSADGDPAKPPSGSGGGAGSSTVTGGSTSSDGGNVTGGTTFAGGGAGGGGSTSGSTSGGSAGSLGSGGGASGGSTSGGSAGAGGSAGGSGGASGGTGGSGSTLFFSDDFEGAAVGGPPDTSKWNRYELAGNAPVTAAATVDDAQHHGGSHSLKTVGVAGYAMYTAMKATASLPALNGMIFGRMFIRFGSALPSAHTGFALLTDSSQAGKMLRIGGQNGAMQWNREDGDDTLPDQSPAGIAASYAPTAGTWFCFELSIEQSTGKLGAWVDGTAVSGMTNDGTPTQDLDARWLNKAGYKPNVQDISIGWQDYGGAAMTLWFDDFALSGSRINCN